MGKVFVIAVLSFTVLLLLCISGVRGQACSGHGSTVLSNECNCYQGYYGDSCSSGTGSSCVSEAKRQTDGCQGSCGKLGADGVVSAPPVGTEYDWISTNGGIDGIGKIPPSGFGAETTGSVLTSAAFQANAGSALQFYFNYVTSDGAGFADYAWAMLQQPDGTEVALLFTARTKSEGTIVPGSGLPSIVATLTPPSVEITPGATAWSPLGGSSGSCFSGGCGNTGWIRSDYTIATSGTYKLAFGVVNVIDSGYQTGMAIAGIQVDGVDIGTGGGGPTTPTQPSLIATALRSGLNLTVIIPAVPNRGSTYVFLTKENYTDRTPCNFLSEESSGLWKRTSSCHGDVYTGIFDLPTLKKCGFVSKESERPIYTGKVKLRWFDNVAGSLKRETDISNLNEYSVTPHYDYGFNPGVVIVESVNSQSSLDSYEVFGVQDIGLTFKTQTLSPYGVIPEEMWLSFDATTANDNSQWNVGADAVDGQVISDCSSGNVAVNTSCTTTYTIRLRNTDITRLACSLDGEWTLKYKYTCVAAAGNCPADLDTSTVQESIITFADFHLNLFCPQSCNSLGQWETPYCNCYSGYAPSTSDQQDCIAVVDDSCEFESTAQLDTFSHEQSKIDKVTLLNNYLTIEITNDVNYNTTVSYISFEHGNDACNYPGELWTKSVTDDCKNHFTLFAIWTDADTCGWTRSEDETHYIYTATLLITHEELNGVLLEEVPTYRNLTTRLNVQINFLKYIEIQTDIRVFAPVDTEAAIISQEYDPSTLNAHFDLQTVVQWPYRYTSFMVTPPGASTPVESIMLLEDCEDTEGEWCEQSWRYTFTPSSCDLTGTYLWTFVLSCSLEGNCPVDFETNTTLVVTNIVSEEFCSYTTEDITFTASLDSYGNGDYSAAQYYFLQNATAYFMAKTDTVGIIVDTWISDVAISDGSSTYQLSDSDSATGLGDTANLQYYPGSDSAAFSFKLLHDFIQVPTIYSKAFTVTATVHVTFQDTYSDKREVKFELEAGQAPSTQTAVVKSGIFVSAVAEDVNEKDAKEDLDTKSTDGLGYLTYVMAAVGVVFIAATVFAAFMVYKKIRGNSSANYSTLELNNQ